MPAVAKAPAGCSLARRGVSEGGWAPSCRRLKEGGHKGRPYDHDDLVNFDAFETLLLPRRHVGLDDLLVDDDQVARQRPGAHQHRDVVGLLDREPAGYLR